MTTARSDLSLLCCVLCAALSGCGPGPEPPEPKRDVSIAFAARVGETPFACSDEDGPTLYERLGTSEASASLKDFRFYVSNVRLLDADGEEVPVTLDDSIWQHEDVALLDFEDGTGDCVDVGNREMNDAVHGTVPEGDYDGLAFDLAVPFELNHLDAASGDTPSPLNLMAMFWSWQVGHKFARLDFNVQQAGGWNVHLGSTGCMSDGSAQAPSTECSRPNAAHIVLESFDLDADTIALDAAALVADADLTADTGGAAGCQSFPADEEECALVFPKLGLSFETGQCDGGCAAQAAFRVLP